MAKEWFARKSALIETEKIFLKANTLADLTLNGERVLTAADILNTWESAAYNGQRIANLTVPISPASTPLLLPTTATTNTIPGFTKTSATQFTATKKGNYLIILQNNTTAGACLNIQMNIDSANYDGRTQVNPLLTGNAPAFAATFQYIQTADGTHTLDWVISGDSFPTAGTTPTVSALDVQIFYWKS